MSEPFQPASEEVPAPPQAAADVEVQVRRMEGVRALEYRPFPTTHRFHVSPAYIRIILGPRGSGKSSACINELWRLAQEQQRGTDGLRHSIWVIIRNTYGELLQTTLKSFLYWFPEGAFGRLRRGMPITYEVEYEDIRAEFIFLAMDKPEDVRKLLSMEATGAWINEAREVPREVLDHLPGTVGRWPPSQMGGPTRSCILCDSNPPAEDAWIPRLEADVEKARNQQHDRKYFEQLPTGWDGVLPPELVPLGWASEGDGDLLDIPLDPTDYEFFHQPSGLSPEAENIPNLPGGYRYYVRLGQGKSPAFIQSLVLGKYSGVLGGTPVYEEFKEWNIIQGIRVPWHVSPRPLEPIKGWPIYLGWDYGLTPCLVIAQLSPRGQLLILQEIESKRMGLKQFVRDRARPWLAAKYAGHEIISTGDPSGEAMSPVDEITCHQVLLEAGIPTDPAFTNAFMTRRNAVGDFLTHTVDGQPAIVIDPRCRTLIEGFRRGYRYRIAKVEGEERETERVDKNGNRFTHPHDCLQYICLRIQLDQGWTEFDEQLQAAGDHSPVVP
jgi:hypothetical protein